MRHEQGIIVPPSEINPFELDLNELSPEEIIRSVGGWKEGHFAFRTGEHGNGYIDKMGFLRYPNVMREIGIRLARQFDDLKDRVDLVVGPSIIGAIIACSTAEELQVSYSVTYRTKDDQAIHFHRGFVPDEGSGILFVDDFVFSGTDLTDNIRFMQRRGMDVVGA